MDILGKFAAVSRAQWIFAATIVAISFFAWFVSYLALYRIYGGFEIWASSVFLIFLLSIAAGISFFLLGPKYFAVLTYLLAALPSFIFFGWRGYEIFGTLVFFLAMAGGYALVKREEGWLIKFMYVRLIKRGLPIFFTGLAFSLAVFYNTSPVGKIFERPQIPEGVFEVMLAPTEYMLRSVMPGFDKNMNLQDIEVLASRELPGFLNIPPAVVSNFVQNFFAGVSEEVKSKNLVQFLTETVNIQLDAIIQPYRQFLPIVFLFGLFLVFKAISIPLMWLSVGASWVFIKLLLHFKIFKITKIDTQKEKLVL